MSDFAAFLIELILLSRFMPSRETILFVGFKFKYKQYFCGFWDVLGCDIISFYVFIKKSKFLQIFFVFG